LVEVSKASLYDDNVNRRGDQSASTKIFNLIRGMRESGAAATGEGSGELDMRRVRERVLAKGFTAQQLEAALDEYASIDVSHSRSTTLLDHNEMLTIFCVDLANCCRRNQARVHRGWRG
jgi:DNA replication licensing factor MCM7